MRGGLLFSGWDRGSDFAGIPDYIGVTAKFANAMALAGG